MNSWYQSRRAVAEYLLFHYGSGETVLPWSFGPRDALEFPVRCVTECLQAERLRPGARALDLGCATGRSAFELARFCTDVVAIDLSDAFIEAARRLQSAGSIDFEIPVENGIETRVTARVPEGVDRTRVRFQTGDALDLPADLGTFDVVLAANLIDRVPRPRDLLAMLPRLLNPGGQLILTSPYTWLEDFTPRAEWLTADGTSSLAALEQALKGLRRIRRLDLPFLIREHVRKFQWSVAEATVWILEDES